MTEAKIPMAGTMSGKSTAGVGLLVDGRRRPSSPRMSDEMMVIS